MLSSLGIAHRRGAYRDPESQAFIESWFGKLKERLIWRSEFETLDEAREAIGAYVDTPMMLCTPIADTLALSSMLDGPHAWHSSLSTRGDVEVIRVDP